jgi:hypothetical protein
MRWDVRGDQELEQVLLRSSHVLAGLNEPCNVSICQMGHDELADVREKQG